MAHFTTDLQGAGSGLSCEEREALRDNCDSALDLIESSAGALLLYECSLKIGTLSHGGASAAGDVQIFFFVIYADDTSIDRCAAPLEHLGRALTDPALTGMRSYSGKLNELLTFGRGGEKPLEISEFINMDISHKGHLLRASIDFLRSGGHGTPSTFIDLPLWRATLLSNTALLSALGQKTIMLPSLQTFSEYIDEPC